jgi:hypothetical protein
VIAPSATCSHHPLREATGICVRCRSAMCSDCITKIDGINHCRDCLESMTKQAPAHRTRTRLHVPAWLSLSLGILVISALCYLMIDVMMPGSAAP